MSILQQLDLGRKHYRKYSQTDRARVIATRYGSTTDFTQVQRSYNEVSRELGIPLKTCESILRRFVKGGRRLAPFIEPKRR